MRHAVNDALCCVCLRLQRWEYRLGSLLKIDSTNCGALVRVDSSDPIGLHREAS
jgi:hypothetical protein